MIEPLLSVRGLTKDHGIRTVLKGVDLEIGKGELLGLVGENGAGKSTLVSILAGVYPPSSGSMQLSGEAFEPSSEMAGQQSGVGLIKQRIEIDPTLTVAQAIFRNTFQSSRSHAELRRQAEFMLNDIGVKISADVQIGDLARSQHGLVEATRMLAEDSQLVIMDEVTATASVMEIDEVHFIINRLARQGRSVLYISHRLSEVLDISDRVVVLRDGSIYANDPASEHSVASLSQLMLNRVVVTERVRQTVRDGDEVLEVAGMVVPDQLHGVSFTLHRGQVLGLTGARESGLHAIASGLMGDTPATYESLMVQGQQRQINSPEDAAALRIAYFSDDDDELGMSRDESIARSMMTGGWDAEMDFNEEVAALREIIGMIQDLEIKTKSIRGDVSSLSGGDQHKLALTKWMAIDCDVLILNAPTRGLDVWARQEVYELMADSTKSGKSVILISNDPDELVQWSDQIGLVDGGRITTWIDADQTTPEAMREILSRRPDSAVG